MAHPIPDPHIYKVIQLVGSSTSTIEDAIGTAIKRASATLKHLRWFEVVEMRGHIEGDKVRHYQVTLKIGFTVDDEVDDDDDDEDEDEEDEEEEDEEDEDEEEEEEEEEETEQQTPSRGGGGGPRSSKR